MASVLVEKLSKLVPYSILNIYRHGSMNYGTYREGQSDHDYIIIYQMEEEKTEYKDPEINITGYNQTEYIKMMNLGDMGILESYFHPIFITIDIELTIDKLNLRHWISQKADNSYVKAKKKLLDG
jgi:hypothetical protein